MTRYDQTAGSHDPSRSRAPRSPMDWASDTVRNKPEALLLLAAGCALLIGAGRSVVSSSPRGGLAGAWASDRLSSIGSQAASYASDAGSRVSQTAGSVADHATSYAGALSDTASSYAGAVSDYAQSAGQGIADRSGRLFNQTQSSLEASLDYLIREQPLLLGALGLAAGAAMGAALPATEVENRALGEARDQLAQAATQAASDRLSRLRTAAGTVGDKVKEAASHHGLSPEGLKDMAHEVAEGVKAAAAAPSNQKDAPQKDTPQKDTSGRSPAQGGSQSSTSGAKAN